MSTELPVFGDGQSLPPTQPTDVTPQSDAAPAAAPEEPRKGIDEMKKRIDRLFAQKKAAEEQAAVEREKAETLMRRIDDLERRLAASAVASPTYLPPAAPQTNDVGAAVRQALQPFLERFEQRERMETLRSAQERSWAAAADEFPELSDPRAELRAAAEYILDRDPELQASPNGPYRAVLMARGFVRSDLRPDRAAASSMVGAQGESEGQSLAQIRKEYTEQLRKGISSPIDFARARALQRKLKE